MVGKASRPFLPSEASRRRKRRSSCSTGTSRAWSSTRKMRSAAGSSTAPRSAPTAWTRRLVCPSDSARVARSVALAPLADVRVRGDRLDVERAENLREDERGRRERVVDDDAEAAGADRLHVERLEQVLDVRLGRARGVGDLPHLVPRGAAELLAGVVLLDLLDERRRRGRARRLEDPDLHHLGVGRARLDVDAGVEALRLQEVTVHGGRHDLEVGGVHAGRVDAGDQRPADAGGTR